MEIEVNDSNKKDSAVSLSWVAGTRERESQGLLFFKRPNKQLMVNCT